MSVLYYSSPRINGIIQEMVHTAAIADAIVQKKRAGVKAGGVLYEILYFGPYHFIRLDSGLLLGMYNEYTQQGVDLYPCISEWIPDSCHKFLCGYLYHMGATRVYMWYNQRAQYAED